MTEATACPCSRCRATRECTPSHRALRSLLAYVEPERRQFLASQLDPAVVGGASDAEIAEICEIPLEALSALRRTEQAYNDGIEARLESLAWDEPTRQVLRECWQRRLDWGPRTPASSAGFWDLALRVRGGCLKLRLPRILDSVAILFDVFLRDCYFVDVPVPAIYDLGANIGLSSTYLYTLHPGAQLICVEPALWSRELLEHNLRRNRFPARIVPVAVGSESGTTSLRYCDQAPGLSTTIPSVNLGASSADESVRCVRLEEIVQGSGYGLKIDIEGAEHLLVESPEAIAGARWIVGEIHLGPTLVSLERARDFENLLRRHFQVELDGPGVYGDTVTYQFIAKRA